MHHRAHALRAAFIFLSCLQCAYTFEVPETLEDNACIHFGHSLHEQGMTHQTITRTATYSAVLKRHRKDYCEDCNSIWTTLRQVGLCKHQNTTVYLNMLCTHMYGCITGRFWHSSTKRKTAAQKLHQCLDSEVSLITHRPVCFSMSSIFV